MHDLEATDDANSGDWLLRCLEAMTLRLEQQELAIARLQAVTPAKADQPRAPGASRYARRSALARMFGATAAFGALALAQQPRAAHADVRATLLLGLGTSLNYGIAATDGIGDDPLTYLPNLTGLAFGVVGTRGAPSFSAARSAGVLGSGYDSGGVVGISQVDVGTSGASGSGLGVLGTSNSNAGVYGLSGSGVGAFGTSTNSVGVYGEATRNAGVYGTSPVYGVWGRSTTGIGVFGQATGRGVGVYGAANTQGWAGFFEGNVYVTGQVLQGGLGNQAVASDSPTDDVGRAQLVGGQASIQVDPSRAPGDYHVFLSAYGDSNGLYVSDTRPDGFDVRERNGGKSTVAFSYRVVAGRKRGAGRQDDAADRAARPTVADRRDIAAPSPPEAPARHAAPLPKRSAKRE